MDGIKGAGENAVVNQLLQYRYMLQAIRDVRSGKVDTDPGQTQTTLRYKLDLDERGVLKSASPARSHAGVTNQEMANIRRLSAEAQRRGEVVVSVNVDYQADVVDGKLAIKAGHTEVVSIKREPGSAARDVYQANKEASASLRPFDAEDDGSIRSLTAGLPPKTADEGEPPALEAPAKQVPDEGAD